MVLPEGCDRRSRARIFRMLLREVEVKNQAGLAKGRMGENGVHGGVDPWTQSHDAVFLLIHSVRTTINDAPNCFHILN